PNVQPAALAAQDAFNQLSTIAGYGYSNADGGTLGAFQLAWPVPLTHVGDELRFTAVDDYGNRSTFCQGDSGGPVFADRVRGCRPTDKVAEKRPREIQGTMSYIQRPGKPPEHATSEPEQHAETCRQAEYDVMQ
ncbi:trypsin-like serine protease, partial [Lactobacillus crispatus]|uniref:trypsin-like serine protease n=1 Tax=Lactobacillus crispatus TaxID=47770 RepID=UPI0010DA9047